MTDFGVGNLVKLLVFLMQTVMASAISGMLLIIAVLAGMIFYLVQASAVPRYMPHPPEPRPVAIPAKPAGRHTAPQVAGLV